MKKLPSKKVILMPKEKKLCKIMMTFTNQRAWLRDNFSKFMIGLFNCLKK